MRTRFLCLIQASSLSLLFAQTTHAVLSTNTWTGGAGSYTNAAMWSPAVVPNSNNGSGTNYVARIDGGNATVSSVVIDPFRGIALDKLIVSVGDTLTLSNGSSLYVTSGLDVTGTVTIASGSATGGDSTALFFGAPQTLGGTGQVVFAGATPDLNYIDALGGTLTIGSDITVHGSGGYIFGDPANWLVNQGTIISEISNGTISVFHALNQGRLIALNGAGLYVNGFTNTGTVTVNNSGTLDLEGSWSNSGVISAQNAAVYLGGTFTTTQATNIIHSGNTTFTIVGNMVNTNGEFTLTPTSGSWFLNGGAIQGGTITTSGGAQLILPLERGGTFDGVRLNGDFTITNGCTLYVANGLTNNATIWMANELGEGGGLLENTILQFTGTQTLGGTGQIVFVGRFAYEDEISVADGTLTISSSMLIRGNGGSIIGDYANWLVNQGTITSETSNRTVYVYYALNQGWLISFNGGGFYLSGFTNSGTVSIGSGSRMQFQSNYAQQAGSTILNGGQLTPANGGGVLIQGGSLVGGGFINATVTNSGSIIPGPAASALTFSSNLVLQGSSVLNFQLGGYTPVSQYGYAVLSNGVNLAGSLAVTLVNDFIPVSGSSFTVLSSGPPITGGFGNVASGFRIQTADGAGSFVYVQNPNSILLYNFEPGPISALPYLAWAQNYFGCTNCPQSSEIADADGTGQNNWFKYVAGLDPTNPASVFVLRIQNVGGQPTQKDLIYNPVVTGRTYRLQLSTDLLGGVYTNLTGFSGPITNGSQVTVTDLNATQSDKFYRIDISLP